MCGIAGFVTTEPGRGSEAALRAMTDVMAHRGPDGEGHWHDDRAFLGHRRLSIIDLAAGGQPMSNESEGLWITFNGEIFNHADLRPDLEKAGLTYRTRCDTETILHAYSQYGESCVERFRGMFAFAIWNRRERRLFAARDRLGIKPFYYFHDGQNFVFGSEIKALLEHPAVDAKFDETMLAEHLAFGYSSDDRTLFRNIKKLPPGHTLSFDAEGRVSIRQYWDVPAASGPQRSEKEWIEECRARFELSVEQRLMSDVPLGMFLSGGVDSGSVAAVMKRLTDSPVKTFSVGYAEREYSELHYAADVAKAIGTEHREISISSSDFFGALPSMIWHEDEPVVWPSSVSLHFVSKLAAEDVKVVLTGEGADELFAGYGRYRFYQMNDRLAGPYGYVPGFLRAGIRKFVEGSSLLGADLRRKLGHTVLGRKASFESLYLDNFFSAFSDAEQRALLKDPARAQDPVYDSFLAHWRASEGRTTLGRLLYSDIKTYLVELCMKQDQMSMSASLESRVPFLDHSFVEFAATVPDSLKLNGKVGKYIFKKVAEDLIPHDILYRKKMGFPTPLKRWLREDAVREVETILRKPDSLVSEYVDRDALDALLARQRSGAVDATDRLWRLLNLQIWGETFLSGGRQKDWRELAA